MDAIEMDVTNNINVSGGLDFATVPALDKRGRVFIDKSPNPVFNLGKVTVSDNAGVALLVSWTRYAKNVGKKVSFVSLPKQLLALIAASGLKEILPIE